MYEYELKYLAAALVYYQAVEVMIKINNEVWDQFIKSLTMGSAASIMYMTYQAILSSSTEHRGDFVIGPNIKQGVLINSVEYNTPSAQPVN